jgi:hypothetical protein
MMYISINNVLMKVAKHILASEMMMNISTMTMMMIIVKMITCYISI